MSRRNQGRYPPETFYRFSPWAGLPARAPGPGKGGGGRHAVSAVRLAGAAICCFFWVGLFLDVASSTPRTHTYPMRRVSDLAARVSLQQRAARAAWQTKSRLGRRASVSASNLCHQPIAARYSTSPRKQGYTNAGGVDAGMLHCRRKRLAAVVLTWC